MACLPGPRRPRAGGGRPSRRRVARVGLGWWTRRGACSGRERSWVRQRPWPAWGHPRWRTCGLTCAPPRPPLGPSRGIVRTAGSLLGFIHGHRTPHTRQVPSAPAVPAGGHRPTSWALTIPRAAARPTDPRPCSGQPPAAGRPYSGAHPNRPGPDGTAHSRHRPAEPDRRTCDPARPRSLQTHPVG